MEILLAVLLLAAAGFGVWFWLIAAAGTAYKAKILCSALFVSGRELDAERAPEISADSYGLLTLFGATVDRERKRVSASFWGLRRRTAVYRPGLGATLAIGPLAAVSVPSPAAVASELPVEQRASLSEVLKESFAESAPHARRTRAVVIWQDGRIVGERYGELSPETPLPGWSMSKSVFAALAGALISEGSLSLDAKDLLPEWSGDARSQITVEDLLRMRSGLRFAERYSNPLSDVVQMLFNRADAGGYAARRPLESPPGTVFDYSSGTSNILSLIMRRRLGDERYWALPRRALFDPLGMPRALIEPDASGTFVASSFAFATAREWTRFGALWAQDGLWEGRRLLPEGWTRFCATPTPQSGGRYGAHWWLKLHDGLGGSTPEAASLPPDAMHALGHEGQCLTVIPSRKLVALRLGLSIYLDGWNHARFLARVLDAL